MVKNEGSRGKNKVGKLEAHFSCTSHMAALRDFTVFVREDGQVDFLLTKQQKRYIVDNETEKERNREVIAMLFDVAKTLTRNGIAFRGNNSEENGNFRQIVRLLPRHNPVLKSWMADGPNRMYHSTYLSTQSQNEFIALLGEDVRSTISHSDDMSVAVRYVDIKTCTPKERPVQITKTVEKTGAGQAEDIVK